MLKSSKLNLLIALLIGIILALIFSNNSTQAQQTSNAPWITGRVHDKQNQAVVGATVALIAPNKTEPLAETTTQPDGRYALVLPDTIIYGDADKVSVGHIVLPLQDFLPNGLSIHIERSHFKSTNLSLSEDIIKSLRSGSTLIIPDFTLQRHINPAFWIATLIFVVVLVFIATGIFHNTLSALIGVSLLFLASYLGHPLYEGLFIFDFPAALNYIDWNVIFLIMGMMIIIAVIENTGIFQWLAFFAYRVSGGRMFVLLPILMLITGVASAFLDNVTTMLLMTPITVQIAIAVGINPLALLIPEVMASNVIGVSTLVGTPTNILIGSYGGISFNDFMQNLTPGVLLAFVGLVIYSSLVYRKDLAKAHGTSELLMEKLAERGRITEPGHLKKAGWVGAGMLIMFVFGEKIHLLPAVTALIGATALMVWIKPNIDEMIEAVDWTTLVFFMSLFMVVGAIQEVGLISYIADSIGKLVGDNLMLAMLVVTWVSAILSMLIANIPFTAAMLPVVGYLTATIPGAENQALFFCLSVGAAMGGNGSLIGASANMVTAGISEAAGYPISYSYFMKKGLPALFITVALSSLWLLLRFL
ncbi:MAG: SLC13 family permease [Chloroflexota bacterium]|nr:SLC13 family permease [Chloroflexota bacterium]